MKHLQTTKHNDHRHLACSLRRSSVFSAPCLAGFFLATFFLSPASAYAQQANAYGIQVDPDEANKNYYDNQLSELTGANDDDDEEVLTTDTHLHDSSGERDNNSALSGPSQAAGALFGTGGAEEAQAKEQARNQARWQTFDEGDNKYYRDSAEMKMRKENNSPLPERKPFGDTLGEIEQKLAPRKTTY